MYSQRPSAAEIPQIRKCSPKGIEPNAKTPPMTPENWQHLINIVTKLAHEKHIKDCMIHDLKARMHNLETTIDTSTVPISLRKQWNSDIVAPRADTFTMNSLPSFLRGRLRRSYLLISKPVSTVSTRRSSYRLTFHQYLGVPGLGIGVSPSSHHAPYFHTEEILFLSPLTLERLAKSIPGEKERKLPDSVLKYCRGEKKEFVRDWMKGYINLERGEEDFAFCVDVGRGGWESDMWIEYIGMFDGMGKLIGENRLGCSVAAPDTAPATSPKRAAVVPCGSEVKRGKSRHYEEDVLELSVSRMDIVM